jgi:hypothetical protein
MSSQSVLTLAPKLHPLSGIARVVQATPDVALPIGYDLDAAFEELDPGPPPA